MAIQGKLQIAGKSYAVVECTYDFDQQIDDTGKPTSRITGGQITFVVPSTSDDDLFFHKWMMNKTMVHSGVFRFVVFSHSNKRSYRTVAFANAYCIHLKDYFNDNDSRLMYTTVTISAQGIRVGRVDQALFFNEWNKDDGSSLSFEEWVFDHLFG